MNKSKPWVILAKVGGSLLAVLAGVLAGVIVMLFSGGGDWRIGFMLVSLFALPVWALVLLPLHVLLPRSSRFWHPGASAVFGGAVGAVLLTAYFVFSHLVDLLWFFLPVGILVGVVTGLVGSAIARCYATKNA